MSCVHLATVVRLMAKDLERWHSDVTNYVQTQLFWFGSGMWCVRFRRRGCRCARGGQRRPVDALGIGNACIAFPGAGPTGAGRAGAGRAGARGAGAGGPGGAGAGRAGVGPGPGAGALWAGPGAGALGATTAGAGALGTRTGLVIGHLDDGETRLRQ